MIREITNLVHQDYFSYIINSSLASEEKSKQINLLKRKRNSEYLKAKLYHDIIIQKDKTFSIINNSNQENIRQLNESRNTKNELQSYSSICEANNSKNLLSEYSSDIKQEENNKLQIIIDYKEENLINNSFTTNNPSPKFKFFKIEKNIMNLGTNNEVKVLKNRKIVYINSDLLNSYSSSRYIKKLKRVNFVKRSKTSSKYRGVSKNGNNWQALIMANNTKYYIGSYPSEELAARAYDIHAIKKRGVKARTNFPYNNTQIKNIYEKNINIKCNKISDIMKQIDN